MGSEGKTFKLGLQRSETVNSDDESSSSDDEAAANNKAASQLAVKKMEAADSDSDASGEKVVRVEGASDSD